VSVDPFRIFAQANQGFRIFEGYVTQAPTAVNTMLYAASSAQPRVEIGPAPWPARGTTLPASGDRVLIAYADNGSSWILAWWPFS
jgi:hypothetical protein